MKKVLPLSESVEFWVDVASGWNSQVSEVEASCDMLVLKRFGGVSLLTEKNYNILKYCMEIQKFRKMWRMMNYLHFIIISLGVIETWALEIDRSVWMQLEGFDHILFNIWIGTTRV